MQGFNFLALCFHFEQIGARGGGWHLFVRCFQKWIRADCRLLWRMDCAERKTITFTHCVVALRRNKHVGSDNQLVICKVYTR